MNKQSISAIVVSMVLFASCGSNTQVNNHGAQHDGNSAAHAAMKPQDEKEIIEKYAKSKGLKGEFTPSGLFVSIEEPGTGEFPTPQSILKAEYTGYLLDGSVFDASTPGSPFKFRLNEVIPGWTEGLQKFKKGGKGKLIIPSNLGYGPNGAGPIPPNSILAFDITLVDFK